MDSDLKPVKRAPAKKLHIKTILESQLDTGSSPPVLRLNNGETCSRVRLLGLVVNKRAKNGLTDQVDAEYNILTGENSIERLYTSIDLDDGTAIVNVRAWDDEAASLSKYNIGEMVEIIGKPKEYAGRLYILYECGLVVSDIHWWLLHELNILKDSLDKKYESEGQDQVLTGNLNKHIINNLIGDKTEANTVSESSAQLSLLEQLLEAICKLDKGDGAALPSIEGELAGFESENIREALKQLLSEGTIYECKTQRYKKSY